jgi:hypothetical protein
MSNGALARVSAATASEVCNRFAPGEAARELLREEMTPRPYLDLLIAKEEFPDATRFLAHALAKREAVWWAYLCARKVAGEDPPAPIFAALRAAEAWVAEPSEENRREALPAAEAAGYGTPAGCAAAAAFWSGGSLAPPNLPAIPPAEHLSAHGAACAVMLAAVASEPEKAPEKSRAFLRLGVEIAEGAHPWPEPAPAPAAPPEPTAAAPAPRPHTPKDPRPTLNWD